MILTKTFFSLSGLYIVFKRLFSTSLRHNIPDLIHAQNLCVCKHMTIDGSRIRYNLSDILANIRLIGQGKLHTTVAHSPVINVDHASVVGPAGWDLRDPCLIPTSHIDDGVWQARPLNRPEDFEFLVFSMQSACLSLPGICKALLGGIP